MKDRKRFARRTAERRAAGLCPRCGKTGPAPGRTVCAACAEKRNRASRSRDVRLKAEGQPRRDPVRAREYERERSRRQAAARLEAGLCVRCGREPALAERRLCEPCLVKRRESERNRYRKANAAGLMYGGRDPAGKRKSARAASKRRQRMRLDAGRCTRCGRRPRVDGGTTCEPCRLKRQPGHRAGAVRSTQVRRVVRAVRQRHDRRRLEVRALRNTRIGEQVGRTKERRGAPEIRRKAFAKRMYRLRGCFSRSREVRSVRPAIV